ncbi:MAG: putative lipid II flippase FtsW [Candidatus Omnitrophota bacterium]
MQKTRKAIFIITLILAAFGAVMIYSSSAIYAYDKMGDSMFFLKRHLLYLILGFVAMIAVMSLDLGSIEKHSKKLMFATLFMLVLVLIPNLGVSIAGARRWFRIGFLSFQPSEMAKFILVIYLASFLSRKGYKIKDFLEGYIPCISVSALTCLLILLQPDLGTAISVIYIAFLLIFAAGGRIKHLLLSALAGIPFLYFLIFSVPYRRRRMLVFLDPWDDKKGAGFQIIQSFLALGSGGLLGVGLGQSKQKLFYLPEAHTDFIFSIIGEELGFLGAASLLALFAIFVWNAMSAFFKIDKVFNKFLIFGIANMIAFEVIINIGVSAGVFPTKGLPLPFISYGGSSLIFHLMAVGLMLNAMREQ